MPKIGKTELKWYALGLAREYDRWVVCIDMSFIAHKEEDDKIIASYVYGWIGKKN